jgi:hypothetical protein
MQLRRKRPARRPWSIKKVSLKHVSIIKKRLKLKVYIWLRQVPCSFCISKKAPKTSPAKDHSAFCRQQLCGAAVHSGELHLISTQRAKD